MTFPLCITMSSTKAFVFAFLMQNIPIIEAY